LEKTLSEVRQDTNGYQFSCWYDESVDMRMEILEAKKKCNTFEILCVFADADTPAVVRSLGAHDEENKSRLDSVRTYFLANGWMPAEET